MKAGEAVGALIEEAKANVQVVSPKTKPAIRVKAEPVAEPVESPAVEVAEDATA
jgi:hypothetical protein